MSKDFLQKFMFENIPVRGCLVRLQHSWQEVQRRAKPEADVIELLGQALCAASVLASSIKFEGTVSLQVQSSGKLRFLLGQCSQKHLVRGIARRNAELEESTELLVSPVLSINLEPDDEGSPYQGIVPMETASLSDALELYFTQSEQLETRFWLVANPDCCAAFMLQRMPGVTSEDDDFVRLSYLASTLTDREMVEEEPSHLLHLLFSEDTLRLYEAEPLRFGCKCSPQRVAGVLLSLGKQDMESLLLERGRVEVNCEYCGQDYQFDQVDIAALFADSAFRLGGSQGVH